MPDLVKCAKKAAACIHVGVYLKHAPAWTCGSFSFYVTDQNKQSDCRHFSYSFRSDAQCGHIYCVDVDLGLAERADLGGRSRLRGRSVQLVDAFDHQEDDESRQQKLYDDLNEINRMQ